MFVIVGFIFTAILNALILHEDFDSVEFSQDTATNILISPVILHFAYNLYHPKFTHRLGKICLFSVISFSLTTSLTSLLLYYGWASQYGHAEHILALHCVAFATVLSLSDPLFSSRNVRRTIGGHDVLLSGEAILGFALASNLYIKIVQVLHWQEYSQEPLGVTNFAWLAFAIVFDFVLGSLLGAFWGFFSALVTRYTTEASSYYEPTICLLTASLAHLTACNLGLSYVAALITVGLVQQRYTMINMSVISGSSTRSFVHGLSYVNEAVLMLLLGSQLANLLNDTSTLTTDVAVLAVAGFFFSLLSRTVSCLILTVTRAAIGTIDCKLLAILVMGAERGTINYVLFLAYRNSPHDGQVQLFHDALLIIIGATVLFQGILSEVLTVDFREEGDERTALRSLVFLAARVAGDGLEEATGDTHNVAHLPLHRANWLIRLEARLYRFFYQVDMEHGYSSEDHQAALIRQRQFFEMLAKHDMLPPENWQGGRERGEETRPGDVSMS
jgi:hypothetical protein